MPVKSKVAVKSTRKEVLSKALWEVLKKHPVNKRFDYTKVVPMSGTKGELKDHLKDYEESDKALCWDIMQEGFRKDRTLEHIGGKQWARIK